MGSQRVRHDWGTSTFTFNLRRPFLGRIGVAGEKKGNGIWIRRKEGRLVRTRKGQGNWNWKSSTSEPVRDGWDPRSSSQRSDGEAQLIQRVGTFCFLISLQHWILGEDTAGKWCRDSKRKKETSVEQIPGRKLKPKLDLCTSLWVVPNPGGKLAWQGGNIDFSTGQIDHKV